MSTLTILSEVQIPLLSSMLLGGFAAKLLRVLRRRSLAEGLGPTALFPVRLRRPVAVAFCVAEVSFGAGLATTADSTFVGAARYIRVGSALLFVVATCALIELRSVRPDLGCGCFGEFSTSPITGRTIARSALLAISALATIGLREFELPTKVGGGILFLVVLAIEIAVIAGLSPEVRGVLVRIGYSTPCELRVLSHEQVVAVLQRSKLWRRQQGLVAHLEPTDVWREMCWSYIAYPSRVAGRDAQLVFAVYLQHRRPAILSALVDSATGAVFPWPTLTPRHGQLHRPPWQPRGAGAPQELRPLRPEIPAGPDLPGLPGLPGVARAR